jgi:hypothetical protein
VNEKAAKGVEAIPLLTDGSELPMDVENLANKGGTGAALANVGGQEVGLPPSPVKPPTQKKHKKGE